MTYRTLALTALLVPGFPIAGLTAQQPTSKPRFYIGPTFGLYRSLLASSLYPSAPVGILVESPAPALPGTPARDGTTIGGLIDFGVDRLSVQFQMEHRSYQEYLIEPSNPIEDGRIRRYTTVGDPRPAAAAATGRVRFRFLTIGQNSLSVHGGVSKFLGRPQKAAMFGLDLRRRTALGILTAEMGFERYRVSLSATDLTIQHGITVFEQSTTSQPRITAGVLRIGFLANWARK